MPGKSPRSLAPGSTSRHQFGAAVRAAREQASMTQDQLAEIACCVKSWVSKIENGRSYPDPHFAAACDTAFPEQQGWFSSFVEAQGWGPGGREYFRPWQEIEAGAVGLLFWGANAFPGLLQSEAYAQAIIRSWMPDGDEQGEADLRLRMKRQQELLYREQPVRVLTVLAEAVLYRQVGDAATMTEALGHVIKCTELPHVTVQVVPSPDGLAGLAGAFAIATSPGSAGVAAYIESSVLPRVERDPASVALAMRLHDHLRSLALPVKASLGMMKEAQEKWGIQ